MRILFDSQKEKYKTPFGCVTPGEEITLRVQIPVSVEAARVELQLELENGENYVNHYFRKTAAHHPYETWVCDFSIPDTGLYFYYFRITGKTGTFRLFKQDSDTNMEAGDKWQISCIPADFTVPDWIKGAMIYQIFPDRFCKVGDPDLKDKLTPYTLHETWQAAPVNDGKNRDFFGGNFRGIREKLPYIASLGATVVYLNPICKSASNHRYDTADYLTPDPMLGSLEEFRDLCESAHALKLRVVLDGVFSHTGADSIYFNKYGHFPCLGAYQSQESPYYSWYRFAEHPEKYACWWGFESLPTLNKENPQVLAFFKSVCAHWLNQGADGFRLDVADELPPEFLKNLKSHLRKCRPDAIFIGEVWEDASNKIAYGLRRRYFVDGVLDSVMNYPFREAILTFLRQAEGKAFQKAVMTILENYPHGVTLANMNLLGSHDTQRIFTALGQSKPLLFLATALQFLLPGSPSVYYGDEAGMTGGKDPFNRRTYPWGAEDPEILHHFRTLGNLRKTYPALRFGKLKFLKAQGGELIFTRTWQNTRIKCYVNLNGSHTPKTGQVLQRQEFYTITEEKNMDEIIVSGYCRAIDSSRTVMVDEGEADCFYPDCPHAADCPIAKQLKIES